MITNLLIYSLICFLLLIIFSKISYKFNLLDFPNNRKKHLKPVAYTGGLILATIYIISIYMFGFYKNELNLILSFSFLIALVGFLDDKYNLNIGGKLSLQFFPIIYLIFFENLNLIQLGNYGYFYLELNSFSIPFTVLAVIFLINSFNYFDGLDGTLSFSTISVLIILYFLSSDSNIRFFLIVVIIPLLLFLCFNFSILKLPKLFLGDSGSLLLGFIIAFTLIYTANIELIHPILIAWSISIFVYEFMSVNFIRLYHNKNPFKAGNDHLHHKLFKHTKSIFLTNFYIFTLNIIFFLIGYISYKFAGSLFSLVLFILFFITFLFIRKKYS